MTASERKGAFRSSIGTVFEWYDCYLYGWDGPAQNRQGFYSAFDGQHPVIFALRTVSSAGLLVAARRAHLCSAASATCRDGGSKLPLTITLMGIFDIPGLAVLRLRIDWLDSFRSPIGRQAAAGPGARRRIRPEPRPMSPSSPAGTPRPSHLVESKRGRPSVSPSLAGRLRRRQKMSPESFADARSTADGAIPYLCRIICSAFQSGSSATCRNADVKKMTDEGKQSKSAVCPRLRHMAERKDCLIALFGLTDGSVIGTAASSMPAVFLVYTLKAAGQPPTSR